MIDSDNTEMAENLRRVLPATFESLSPRRKLPHFLLMVIDGDVQNKTLYNLETNVASGEIRVNNQYLVAPGTEIKFEDLETGETKTGTYKILNDRPIAKIAYINFMEAINPFLGKDSSQKLTEEQILNGVSEGERHQIGIKLANKYAAEFSCDFSTVLHEMQLWNQKCKPPNDDEEIKQMVQDAVNYQKTKPKQHDTAYQKNIYFSTPPRGGYISEDAAKPMSLDDVEEVLNSTLKRDHENKLMVFLSMLMNYSGDDQQNILFNAPSSTGKSYIALEIAKLFPAEDVDKKGYTSPTAFFHVMGKLCRLDGEPLEDRNAYIESKLNEWEKTRPRPSAPDYNDKSAEAIKERHTLSEWKALRKTEECRLKEEWNRKNLCG